MPEKAKLVTRSTATSSVTADNLNKGSALEFAELDSSLINLRDQTFGIVGDDSSTIDVGAGDTLYVQGGTNVTTETDSSGALIINSSAANDVFKTIAVSGQDSVVADSSTDSLTLVGGTNMTITTNASNDTITFAAAGGGGSASTGDLTFNGSTIISPSNGDITLDPSGTGKVMVVGAGTESATLVVDNGSYPALITSNTGQYLHLTAGGEVDGATGGMITIQDGVNQNILINPHGSGSVILGSSTGDGTVSLEVGAIVVDDNAIFAPRTNDDLYLHTSGSGNVNLENLKLGTGGSVVTTILDEDAMGTNSDTALATQQSIKAYVDANGNTTLSGSTNNTITTVTGANAIQGEANITFDGTVLAVTGNITSSTFMTATGALNAGTSITAGTTIGNDAITIDDNVIATTRSNDELFIQASGTGMITIGNGLVTDWSPSGRYLHGPLSIFKLTGLDPNTMTTSNDRIYGNNRFSVFELNGTDSAQSHSRFRQTSGILMDLNGSSLTSTGIYRGVITDYITSDIKNTAAGDVTLAHHATVLCEPFVQSTEGDITVTEMNGVVVAPYIEAASGSTTTISSATGFYFQTGGSDGSGTNVFTTQYGFKVGPMGGATNYAFYDGTNGQSLFGDVLINQNTISTNSSNADLEINAAGSGTVVLENLSVAGDGATVTGILDEDDMSSDSNVKLATQQSIKAYVDANAGGGASFALLGDGFTANTVALTDGTNVLEGAWAEKTDADGIVTVSGNTFTLAAGTYFVDVKAPQLYGTATGANEQNVPHFYLNNDTDSSIVAGSPENIKFSGPSAGAIRLVGKVDFAGYFTIGAQKTFSIKYVQANATNAKFALGEGSWGQKTQWWLRIQKF